MDVIDDAPGRFAAACAFAFEDEVLENANATLDVDCGAMAPSERLTVSTGAGAGSVEACPPDVVADAVQVKAKKIEMIMVASIVFFMLENLLFFHQ